jgi:hypothetical protein
MKQSKPPRSEYLILCRIVTFGVPRSAEDCPHCRFPQTRQCRLFGWCWEITPIVLLKVWGIVRIVFLNVCNDAIVRLSLS